MIFLVDYMTCMTPLGQETSPSCCLVEMWWIYTQQLFRCPWDKKILVTFFLLNVSQDGQMSCFPSVFHLIGYFSVHWPVGGLNKVFIKRANKYILSYCGLYSMNIMLGARLWLLNQFIIFGSDRSPRSQDVCSVCDIMLTSTLEKFFRDAFKK